MGTRLPSMLRSVGLDPQPPYELTGLTGVLTAYGIATEKEIEIDTFADRVSAECGPDPVLISGPDLGVWAIKP